MPQMIGKNVLIQIILTLVGSMVGFASLSLSARLFGPFILGHLAYVFGLTGLIFAFSDLGLSKAQIHFTAASNSAKKTLGTFLLLKSGLLLATTLAALIIALVTGPGQFEGVFLIVLASELLTRLAEGIFVTFEGLQLSWPQNLARLIAKFFRLIAIVAIGLRLSSILGFGLTYLAEAVVLILLAFWLVGRFLPLKTEPGLMKKYFKYSLPFFVIVPFSYAQTNLLTVLLKHFHSAIEVGFFSAAFSLAMYLKLLFGTVMIFFFPKISNLFGQNKLKEIEYYLNLSLKYQLAIFTPLFIVGFLLRQEIIGLVLGEAFSPSIAVFAWALLGAFVLLIINPYDYVLYATKNHARLVLVNIIGLGLVIALSVYLMKVLALGAVGAALVNLITWIISGLYAIFLVKKHLKFSFYKQSLSFIVPAVVLILIVDSFFNYSQSSLIIKATLSFASALVYWLFLYMVKLIKPIDISYFVSLVKPK